MPKPFDADMEKYYFITVLERLEVDDDGWADTGNTRCWGFYKDKDIAFQAVYENWTDMQETIYNYCQWLTKSENSKKMHRERGHNVGTV